MAVRVLNAASKIQNSEINDLLNTLRSSSLVSAEEQSSLDIPKIVSDILKDVKSGGDQKVAELTSKFDKAQISPDALLVPQKEIKKAFDSAEPNFLKLMRDVIKNITEYQEHIIISDPKPFIRDGRKLGVRYTPIDRVGVYVPGGKALYPSTVLMTVVPAIVAGVKEIIMISPPTGGDINPMALALAYELGIKEVYRMGGAVGLAAAAYGTETISPVQKIVGPGNAFVAEAKRQLFGRVGIDSIAGPSEVLIVADESAKAEWVAADMLAQAEHNPGSAILVTPSNQLAIDVNKEIDKQLNDLDRSEVIAPALEKYGAIILTDSLDQACDYANEFATEHLQIITLDNKSCLNKIRHAGAIFVGPYSPVPLGDYFAGPSHVLPTGGTAKFFGPLSCNDFLKSSSLIEYDEKGILEDAPKIADFASREGLTAHANSALIRKK